MKFNNCNHYTNYCKKIVRSRVGEEYDTSNLTDICKLVYEFGDKQRKYGLRKPSEVFSWILTTLNSSDEVSNAVKHMNHLMTMYEDITMLYSPGYIYRNNYPELYAECELENHALDTLLRLSKEFRAKCEELSYTHGLYFLYNDDELVYVGRSRSGVGRRVITSIEEREECNYVAFAFPKTISDVDLYEVYYIAKLKPRFNADCKHDDELTVSLPELEISTRYAIYDSDQG